MLALTLVTAGRCINEANKGDLDHCNPRVDNDNHEASKPECVHCFFRFFRSAAFLLRAFASAFDAFVA